ncbi:MAG TPA: hypothetical protein PKA41_03535 [Verrucomicrobiota bacterium]|nr:hypothetical protein [Verrucomicrobiota bacterium]
MLSNMCNVKNTVWTRVKTVAEIPSGADVVVEVRAANHITELPSWPFQRVQSGGVMPTGINIRGRYLEVRTTLLRDFCRGDICAGPVLKALYVELANPPGSTPLTISSHPTSWAVAAGDSVSFTVTAPGATAYQWYKDGAFLSGATSPTLNLSGVSCGDAGVYYVRVQNWPYALRSSPARLHVKGDAPFVNIKFDELEPVDADPGENGVTLTDFATVSDTTGCDIPHFQWRRNQVPIPGASGTCTLVNERWRAQLILNNVQREDAGEYSAVFANAYGAFLGTPITLNIRGTAPVEISPHGQVQVQNPSQPVTFTLSTAFDPACIQWYKDGSPIAGANDSTYVIQSPITCEDQGTYSVIVYDSAFLPHKPDYSGEAWVTVDGCQ